MSFPQDSNKTKKAYADYLNNKRVVIVGPAFHMKGAGRGNLIDSYDIIVRVSKGYEIEPGLESAAAKIRFEGQGKKFRIAKDTKKDFGSRTDILYQTLFSQWGNGFETPFKKLKNKIKWLSASMPDKKHKPFIKDFIRYSKKLGIPFHIMDKNCYDQIVKDMRTIPMIMPTVGIDLLQYNIKELYLTGFTFFQKSDKNGLWYYPDYFYENIKHCKDQGSKKHNIKKIFKYVKKMCKEDDRIKCDKVLEELVEK